MGTTFEIAAAFGSSIGPGVDSYPQSPSLEQDLVRQLQAGNELAYRGFVQRYQTKLFRIAQRILGNHGDAEEITQQVFVKVFFSIGSFGGRSSLFSWVYRIAVNECYSVLRRRGSVVSLESPRADDSVSTHLQRHPDPSPSWDDVVLQRDYLNRLLELIPAKDRRLLLLRNVEGLSTAELAAATGQSEPCIKLRLWRIRQRLAKRATRLHSTKHPAHRKRDRVPDLENDQRP